MKKILIADQSKASLVMISEVFKNHYPGVQVLVARTSKEVRDLVEKTEGLDVLVMDFDLPDENGAKTALEIKKKKPLPILITALDREDVSLEIESLLNEYEDCRSWLKKPVNAEVVIAVVQRYCEGKMRVQKRVACHIPVYAEIGEKNIFFSGFIEDCSLSGIKIKPNKFEKTNLEDWSVLLASIDKINTDDSVHLHVPTAADIEFGKSTELSKIFHSKEFLKNTLNQIDPQQKKEKKKTPSKTNSTKNTQTEQSPAFALKTQTMAGRITWTSTESGEWSIGVEFENQLLSKRLFEAIVAAAVKQQKSTQGQSALKQSRS